MKYLVSGELPQDKKVAQKLLYQVPQYVIIDSKLYKQRYSLPLFRCVSKKESNLILHEVHEGFCGDQAGGAEPCQENLKTRVLLSHYEWYEVLKRFFSLAHPQANDQVEAVNKTLKATLKKTLEQAKGAWPEELSKTLWSYHTAAQTSTGSPWPTGTNPCSQLRQKS
ncbi:uncharacterized protein LOC133792163 [Humulus lupulus]|uniref:uncharacterized protein LOC133792163 n=1 Tax=Humulus lupulus TaxID=3486 RepID=UPI002B403DE6|nr:uncharacterized protein LOC133792163 [Humulus lupulus]